MNIGSTRPLPIISQSPSQAPAVNVKPGNSEAERGRNEEPSTREGPRSIAPIDAAEAAEIVLSSLQGAWNREPQNRSRELTGSDVVNPSSEV